MTIFDDLNTAVTTVTTSFNELDTAIQAEIAAIQTGLNTGNNAAIQTAITNLGALSARMTADVAALTSSINTGTNVAPATVWVSTNTYTMGQMAIGSDGVTYTSAIASNLNINPVGDTTSSWTSTPPVVPTPGVRPAPVPARPVSPVSPVAPAVSAWVSTKAYAIGDKVTEQGVTYVALVASTDINPVGHPVTWKTS